MFAETLDKIARFVARRPGFVVSVISIIIILSAISAQNVTLTSGTESMFSKDNVIYKQYQLYQKDFGVGADQLFVLIKGDEVVTLETYRYLLDLQHRIEKIDGVSSVVSPASIVSEIYGYLPSDESVISELTDRYASDLVPKPTLAMMIIQLGTADKNKQEEVAVEVEKAIDFSNPPTGLTLELTGRPALNYQIEKEIGRSFGITMVISIVLMIAILFVTFSGAVRKKYTAFMPLLISVLSVQIVYGIMPLLGIPLSEHTNGALPMLIGLAIEYGAQLQNRYEEERKEGRNVDDSIVISVTRTGLAIIMALVTTVIGFMSMLAPGIPSMAQFGIIASLGLIFAYLLTLTFLPAVLKLIDHWNSRGKVEIRESPERVGLLERSLSAISTLTASRPTGILIAAFLIVLFGAYSAPQIGLETNYNKYVPQDLPAIQRFNEIERIVGGQSTYTIVFVTDEINADTLNRIDKLSRYIVSKEELVYDYSSITKLISDVRKAYGLSGLPESDAELTHILNSLPESEVSRYISGNLVAVHFYSNADTQEEYISLYNALKKDVEYFGWHGGFYVTGGPVIYGEMGRLMTSGQTTMTATAYILIILLLLFVYRSLRKAIVPLIAITSVIGVLNTVMFITGTKQTMMSIALNSITLGLGIDFSIHVLERYFEEREKFSPVDAVRRTIERTGKAITTSALTMAGGFGSLMFSSFPIIQNFGFIALIAILFSLFAALTVVPAFLMLTEGLDARLSSILNNHRSRT
ncbi:hydrophobe/amphiphile efflux-3 (HAE3) family transporter [Archaeoglobus neptunius]|uniref:hydrophobe/amphiphile efflux-3 (HAE3) family transporter n=1 Tax=Archaeoglobus neptunius TaxID=2798580 RepID=UPI0019278E65|nr:hydrophobe/amphiphile efflux-3 (HAE3) family transporter [Archaeoglobus neptunius]